MRIPKRTSHARCGLRWLAAACLVCLVVVVARPVVAGAHPTGQTAITVTAWPDVITLDIFVPLDRLEVALGLLLTDDPVVEIAAHDATLRDRFQRGINVTGASGTPWPTTVGAPELGSLDGVAQLYTKVLARALPGDDTNTFTLGYRVLVDVDPAHSAFVTMRSPDASRLVLVGSIDRSHPHLTMSLDQAEPVSFGSMLHRGVEHFRSGSDHIVFLTLVAASAAFSRQRGRRRVVDLALRTTAFTAGHSVSLALVAAAIVAPPSRPIEVGIAISVLLSAIHLARPLIDHRAEPLMALTFGLIHGAGFAGALNGLGLRGWGLLVPTAAFNIGLEIAQLGADVMIGVPLWWLARHPRARFAIAEPASIAAVAWILNRSIGVRDPFETVLRSFAGSPERLGLALAFGAVVCAGTSRSRRTRDIPATAA